MSRTPLDRAITAAREANASPASATAPADDNPFADQSSDQVSPPPAAAEPPSTSAGPSEAAGFQPEGRADEDMGEAQPPIDRALLLVACAASPAECSQICDDYISQLGDDDYETLSKAANERGRLLLAAKGAKQA